MKEQYHEFRRKKVAETAKTPNSYARKKEIYESMTDDFPRY